jgi:hypothetical protein
VQVWGVPSAEAGEVTPPGSRAPIELRRRWERAERARRRAEGQAGAVLEVGVKSYGQVWAEVWSRTAALVRERREWSPADAVLVEDYVEARRMAADHQAVADAEPYVRGAGGRSFAHPGFERAASARREARQVLAALRLGHLSEVESSEAEASESEDEPVAVGDQAGL